MAAIDKTYVSNWDDFNEIRNWAKDKEIPLKNGTYFKLADLLYHRNLTKEEWDEYSKNDPDYEIVLWNTPTFVDIWLIRNCPFKLVQDRLKEQYGGGWSKESFADHNDADMYEQIKNGTSVYDTYQRNGLGKDSKITFKTIYGKPIRDDKLLWWITVENPDSYWYNEEFDMWYDRLECMPATTNVAHRRGTLTKKNIINLVKKWDFPSGSVIIFEALMKRYSMYKFEVKVK